MIECLGERFGFICNLLIISKINLAQVQLIAIITSIQNIKDGHLCKVR